jgi:hypothetical protein
MIAVLVCGTSKSDLSSTTKRDKIHSNYGWELGQTKAAAKHKLLLTNQPLITPKAAAKNELLFSKPASGAAHLLKSLDFSRQTWLVLASGKPHETYFCRKKCCKHFPVFTCYVVN